MTTPPGRRVTQVIEVSLYGLARVVGQSAQEVRLQKICAGLRIWKGRRALCKDSVRRQIPVTRGEHPPTQVGAGQRVPRQAVEDDVRLVRHGVEQGEDVKVGPGDHATRDLDRALEVMGQEAPVDAHVSVRGPRDLGQPLGEARVPAVGGPEGVAANFALAWLQAAE